MSERGIFFANDWIADAIDRSGPAVLPATPAMLADWTARLLADAEREEGISRAEVEEGLGDLATYIAACLAEAVGRDGKFEAEREFDMHQSHYRMLVLNLILSALIMYLVMFAMIDTIGEFYNNLNMAWMTLMMVAPMGALMLLMMGSMYSDRRKNLVLYAVFAGLFALGTVGTRAQLGIGDAQFLRSMIPHHSGAILMCREAAITDPEIAALCRNIERSQRAEVDQMERILQRY